MYCFCGFCSWCHFLYGISRVSSSEAAETIWSTVVSTVVTVSGTSHSVSGNMPGLAHFNSKCAPPEWELGSKYAGK